MVEAIIKNTLLQNMAASVAFVELLQLHVLVNNRNAPDGSWVNSIERCMNLLNLALAHQNDPQQRALYCDINACFPSI
jgi:hypothetical protein